MAEMQNGYRDRFIFYIKYTSFGAEDKDLGPEINVANNIIYCVSGGCEILSEGAKYTVDPGYMFIARCLECYVIHPIRFPCTLHMISFSPYYFYIIDPELKLNYQFSNRVLGLGNVYGPESIDGEQLIKCFSNIPCFTDAYSRRLTLINTLMNILIELYAAHKDVSPPDIRPRDYALVLDYLNEHLCERLTVEETAERLGMSRPKLDKLVKSATGLTLWNYLTQKRVNKAIQLIHNGVSNHDASMFTGFKDYSTFYKAYVKIVGKPPIADHPGNGNDPLLHNFYPVFGQGEIL